MAKQLERLNELEWPAGEIFANVWQTNWIPVHRLRATGGWSAWDRHERASAPLSHDMSQASTDVLNGIAYDAKGDRLFVTGQELAPNSSKFA